MPGMLVRSIVGRARDQNWIALALELIIVIVGSMLLAQQGDGVGRQQVRLGGAMRITGRELLVLWGLLGLPTDVVSQACPDVDPDSGYPLAATMDTPGVVPSQWLDEVAAAAAYRWKVPSRQRNAYAGWERVSQRVLPPEPRWADDWKPSGSSLALIQLVVFRDGRAPLGSVVAGSGEKRFDETLSSIWQDPMPGAPPFPALPSAYEADSAVVTIHLGKLPEATMIGVARFAAVQTPVDLNRNTMGFAVPGSRGGGPPRVTVKYDVNEAGRVDQESIEFLTRASYEVEDAIRGGLMRARFKPPTSNCRAIRQSVVQTFGG